MFLQARYWFLVYAITLTNSISSDAPLNNLAITNNDIIGYCCESKGLQKWSTKHFTIANIRERNVIVLSMPAERP